MIIGIDIDDTIVTTAPQLLRYADIYNRDDLGNESNTAKHELMGLITDMHYVTQLYGWTNDNRLSFFDKYYKKVLEECIMIDGASEAINKLGGGNKIIFVTSRISDIEGCDAIQISKETLEKNDIKYDELVFNSKDKLQTCLEKKIDIFIDDCPETCKKLNDAGIKTYLMTTILNEKLNKIEYERVHDWQEIYRKVKSYIDECIS